MDVGELGRVVADPAFHLGDGTTAVGSDRNEDGGYVPISPLGLVAWIALVRMLERWPGSGSI